MTISARLIPLAAGDPIENMAIDQVLLESCGAGGVPTLRLYRWKRPTLSLGYFQSLADRSLHRHSTEIDCVRRSTGGGAIVHHHELTYSIVLPVGDLVGAHLDLYETVHGEFISLLRQYGVIATRYHELPHRTRESATQPFLCFQRRTDEDLIVGGYKILGSAQRKVRGAVLQHGSLLLRASRWAPQLPGICDLASAPITVESAAELFAKRIESRFALQWEVEPLTSSERARANVVAESKFGSPQWHGRR